MHAGHGAVMGNHSYLCLAVGEYPCQRGNVVCWGCSQSLFSAGGTHESIVAMPDNSDFSIVASNGHKMTVRKPPFASAVDNRHLVRLLCVSMCHCGCHKYYWNAH